ncbi:MAG: ATP-dependent helicase [Candidatus Electrothrix scaldis]|nr:MAG: ATP-dependent helicase [Candidatus Electrothrix sp. GW3-3]
MNMNEQHTTYPDSYFMPYDRFSHFDALAPTLDLSSLNQAQHAAVTHGEGPVLVIAGAGSGKTMTLVHRTAWLLSRGVSPESVLLLTFTRRAAREMLDRAANLSGCSCTGVMGGTFHSVANILLRRHGYFLGFPSDFTIIDRGDSEGIINHIRTSLNLAGAGKRFPAKRVLFNILSAAVNKSYPVQDIIMREHTHLVEYTHDILAVHREYQAFKENNRLMDYDDLLVNLRRLLSESDIAQERICSQFRYILVDEYQDTNLIQAEIVGLLALEHNNIMAVGDDAQSIYSFRGADFENIMQFPDQYPGAQTIKLEQNYRSVRPILALTNAVIAQAETRYTKELFSDIPGKELPLLYKVSSEKDEARLVASTIHELITAGTPQENIAVLFRSGFHSYNLEIELLAKNIDFDKRGGMKFTESAHVKDVLAFFRLLLNAYDNLSLTRILLMLEKVGPKTVGNILSTVLDHKDPIAALKEYKSRSKWIGNLHALADMLLKLRAPGLTVVARFDLVMTWYEAAFERIYHDDYPKRRHDLEYVRTLAAEYYDIQSFIDDTALDPPEVTEATTNQDPKKKKLVLSTIHSAKGLEWDVVFLIGLADGLFPRQNADDEELEEERRLLYVAATRAKQQLFLMYPELIRTPDRKYHQASLSPFLQQVSPRLYEKVTYRKSHRKVEESAPF